MLALNLHESFHLPNHVHIYLHFYIAFVVNDFLENTKSPVECSNSAGAPVGCLESEYKPNRIATYVFRCSGCVQNFNASSCATDDLVTTITIFSNVSNSEETCNVAYATSLPDSLQMFLSFDGLMPTT